MLDKVPIMLTVIIMMRIRSQHRGRGGESQADGLEVQVPPASTIMRSLYKPHPVL